MRPFFSLLGLSAAFVFTCTGSRAFAADVMLEGPTLTARFGDHGLTALIDARTGQRFAFGSDDFAVTLSGTTYESATLPRPQRATTASLVRYTWTAGAHTIHVVYELEPGWHFVSKRIQVALAPGTSLQIDAITVFRASIDSPVREVFVQDAPRPALGQGKYAAFLRLATGNGLLALAQNPFLDIARDGQRFEIAYRPDMEWRGDYGTFGSDRGLLVPYRLSGRTQPSVMVPEWHIGGEVAPGLDAAEVDAFTSVVRTFLLYRPSKPLNIFVGWCTNDYQIDIATEQGRAEYIRLFDTAARLGAEHVLFAPTNSDLARRDDSTDDWHWENLLWLGLGQKIRKNEWHPRDGPIPPSLQQMLDAARERRLGIVAYVYPVLAFSQDPKWLVTRANAPAGRRYASLGFRSLQDWLIDTLIAFRERTGISGYAFDHTFLDFAGPSPYAQWWGWRRVMETLRARVPDIVIDGRQAYHLYGPWGWLAGSYPHPTFSDEQPESFVPFPDLSVDRVSAARERYTAFRYRNHEFAPSEIVPGFITHQTSRSDDTGDMPRHESDRGIVLERFRVRDWDYLGWRYSLLSSIAISGWNNVINYIPGRDPEEFRHFSGEDQRWFRRWIDWTREHRELLRHTRTIIGQPALGRVDGTAAIQEDRGFVFLFNPNARALDAEFTLDEGIGLSTVRRNYLLREVHPLEGRLIGKPGSGPWTTGDRVIAPMDGQSAVVLEVVPAAPRSGAPVLFNAPGNAALKDGVLTLRDLRGELGTSSELIVTTAAGARVDRVEYEGTSIPFTRVDTSTVKIPVRFEGEPFKHAQPVGTYDSAFQGGRVSARVTIPERVMNQLAAREKAWPLPWTTEDFRTTWLAPHRLLLFVQIAEPDDSWEARLWIDGKQAELRKAFSAVRAVKRTFVGFYADLSLLQPGREYRIDLELPPLRPGQFQGMFFDHVETEYTNRLQGTGYRLQERPDFPGSSQGTDFSKWLASCNRRNSRERSAGR